jgi:O-antigen/teichoic acid export membrane protein
VARRSLATNVAASTANVLAVVGASLLAVPILIDRLGIAGYGLWTLAQSLVIYVTTAEMGFGPALARFTSVHAEERAVVRQMLAAALGAYAAIGLAIVALCHLTAEPLVALFSVPAELEADAIETVGLVGWVAFVALAGAPLAHVLSGLERFTALTLTNVAGSAAFLAAIVFFLAGDARLQDVAYAALLQWTVVAALRAIALRSFLPPSGRLLPGRRLARQLLGFSARLQVAVLATLLNTQTDRIVIGLVASAAILGQASVATQMAEAGRFLAFAAFAPLASRMAIEFGRDGRPALDRLLSVHRRVWVAGVVGATAIGVGATRPAIAAWVGEEYDKAALFAILLLTAYGVGLLPSTSFAYLRAVGKPGIEGRFGVVTVALNLALTVPLGILAGATGVIAATTAAYLLATIWVVRRMRAVVPPSEDRTRQALRLGAPAVVVGAAMYGAGEALVAALPGPLALAAQGAVAALLFGGFMSLLAGVSPRGIARRGGVVARPAGD